MAKHRIKKITLERVYKNLLMISGSMTIVVGIVNQAIKMFQDYTKQAIVLRERASEVVMASFAPHPANPFLTFLSNNWQVLTIGVGLAIIIFVIIFVVDKVKEGDHHG